MKHTFRGGVHPKGHKELSRETPLRLFNPAGEMVFPLSQHIGKPARSLVKKNDPVLVGQVIAEADGFVSANVICSCSGTVTAVEKRRTISGQLLECIVVANDGAFTPCADYETRRDLSGLTNQQILDAVRAAGIVGLGGAGFPTAVKLAPKNPEGIRYVIANGAECEPYLTCNDQLMRTKAAEIVEGLELTLRLFPNAVGIIGIERNKPEAIAAMRAAAAGKEKVSVLPLETKYPQGGEHNLIRVVTGAEYPVSKLPADMGCIVDNVGTLYAIQRAVCYGEPLFTHCATVTGEAIAQPQNFIVRDGTCVRELIEAAGGFRADAPAKKVLAGGPMMGFALASLDVPVVKTTNGLTCMAEDGSEKAAKIQTACLGCGRCSTVCPAGLQPGLMAFAARKGDYEYYEKKLFGLECVACGSCTFACPARRPLTETFKRVKAEILAKKRAEQAGGKK